MIISLQGKMFQFCGKNCSDEYKKINNVMAMCEYCKIEKIVKETVRFSGADKSFCSEGKGKIILPTEHVGPFKSNWWFKLLLYKVIYFILCV